MKVLLVVEYKGDQYSGWQKQPNIITVQGCLDKAIAKVANHNIVTSVSGRTDKGVHAYQQFVHFDTESIRSNDGWLRGINCHLPDDIRVKLVKVMPNDFHARHSSLSRTYHYYINTNSVSSALLPKSMLHFPHKLNLENMQQAAELLIGEHDFSSFRSSKCQAKSAIKIIYSLNVELRPNSVVLIKIKANSFLYNMVRNIVGLLLDIGSGKHPVSHASYVLDSKNRNNGVTKIAPFGLYFMAADYPDRFFLDHLVEKYLF